MILALCLLAFGQAPAANLPAGTGIYYQSGAEWVRLSSILLMAEMDSSWRYILPGPHASVRTHDPRPVFYLRGIRPERGWQFVPVQSRKDSREWRTSRADAHRFAVSPGAISRGGVATEFKSVAPDIVQVRPISDLAPGEYVLAVPRSYLGWVLSAYDFGM